jgi:beta-galactosidase
VSSVTTTRRRSLLAVALKLVPDMETWHADGKDLMHVRIYAVDKKGRRVLNVKDAKAFDKLTFTVKGDANIVAVDNGNIASDELHIGRPSWRSPFSVISFRVPPS